MKSRQMKARIALLIALLIVGGVGADWWMDDLLAAPTAARVDGPDSPPTPSPAAGKVARLDGPDSPPTPSPAP